MNLPAATILNGDSLEVLKTLADNSVDTIVTDPPYGYSFMGKDWDKAVPSVEIWQECLRVLKPGAFACVMSAPRSDVQNAMISRMMEAGFRLDFTPIYWTYASGFPKAGNIGKLVDKRLGVEREVIGKKTYASPAGNDDYAQPMSWDEQASTKRDLTAPATPQAKQLDGSYAGFQPKPAVEVIIVAMKPLSEKTYVDQALANGHGVSWLDDCRVPTNQPDYAKNTNRENVGGHWGNSNGAMVQAHQSGRFPANLLVSNNVIDGGIDYSRYFDLDKWATTLPFLITPKASKREKNAGLEHLEPKRSEYRTGDDVTANTIRERLHNSIPKANHHPTVKPLKLMSYLITLFSRPGDTVLDPFVGSGTTCVAAKQLDRECIGIERELEYVEIATARINAGKADKQLSLL